MRRNKSGISFEERAGITYRDAMHVLARSPSMNLTRVLEYNRGLHGLKPGEYYFDETKLLVRYEGGRTCKIEFTKAGDPKKGRRDGKEQVG